MATHPSLEPLAGLIGEWRGTGQGDYPTIPSFRYLEELSFHDIGTPFLVYTQRTWGQHGQPMHTETGYGVLWRFRTVSPVAFRGNTEMRNPQNVCNTTTIQSGIQGRVMP
ncbi:hypothetical protein C7K25_10840, partial [Gulosibacter molinativorax]